MAATATAIDRPLNDQLAQLDAEVEAAAELAAAARARRRRRDHWRFSADACKPLADFRDDVEFRRREADPEVHLKLTREFCEKVIDEGWVLNASGHGVEVAQPGATDEEVAAGRALTAARQERATFAREHNEALDAEQKAAEADRIRAALADGDPDAIREALNPVPQNTLTTAG